MIVDRPGTGITRVRLVRYRVVRGDTVKSAIRLCVAVYRVDCPAGIDGNDMK
jgi:hypothetical protein